MLNTSDNLIDLLEAVGLNITHLDLYAVDQIDLKAVAMISIYCRKLGIFIYNLCIFSLPTINKKLKRSGYATNHTLYFFCFSKTGFQSMWI